MLGAPVHFGTILTGVFLAQMGVESAGGRSVDPSFFEGRWAFADEGCNEPTNWTIIAGGNFVSDDLIGTWQWRDEKLILNLVDLAIDEETGEAGGKFQMDGPVEIVDRNNFKMTIEPDIYSMKRCPG